MSCKYAKVTWYTQISVNIDEKPMTKIKRKHLSGYFYATFKEKHLTRSFTRRDSACTDNLTAIYNTQQTSEHTHPTQIWYLPFFFSWFPLGLCVLIWMNTQRSHCFYSPTGRRYGHSSCWLLFFSCCQSKWCFLLGWNFFIFVKSWAWITSKKSQRENLRLA